MAEGSPFALAKDIAGFVARFVSNLDLDDLPREQREATTLLKNQAADLRLDMRDYSLADTRISQERVAKEVAERVDAAQATILKLSEYNLLGAADVAQLSALLQQLKAVL
ncbi:MAG TPA: hypothetical protein VL737_00345 [Candidatus Pristimantibacillus sp.]|nr:hypothetical protein [Candidatus Pristimantibacillus sp.]